MCSSASNLTWFGSLRHRSVVHLVVKLRPVVVHVDDVDVEVDGVLHLVAIHVHSVGAQLQAKQSRKVPRKKERERER